MPISDNEKLKAYDQLNRFLAKSMETKPTIDQAEDAVKYLFRTYGAESEEELLEKAEPELIDYYKEIKTEIIKIAQ
ncbi:hypothetical protein HZF08_33525 [Paenibacillus sp. CGMCC 1.16610]|uniref:Uncharacterized protein n=1 Tax=Paenibacillus anseongense TaxID=2682845 RepID=A0ABW9U7A7_9BACL|nr:MULTISPECIES: hypothetical protein [Paenibacillus]MBA2943193.1 hypothetical protein [Paenibacillus sp. CGMCC 1.16610]MVQ33690.1 hypothetical protein [Paenibacillus anseongense]